MLTRMVACAALLALPCHAVTHPVEIGPSCLPSCSAVIPPPQTTKAGPSVSQSLIRAPQDVSQTTEDLRMGGLVATISLRNVGSPPKPVPPPQAGMTPEAALIAVPVLLVLAMMLAPRRRRRRRRRRSLQIFFYSRYRDPYVTF